MNAPFAGPLRASDTAAPAPFVPCRLIEEDTSGYAPTTAPTQKPDALRFWRQVRRDLRLQRAQTLPRSKARSTCDAQLRWATLAVLMLEARG